MTYSAQETSEASGRPVELFTFTRGSLVWRYTSADRDITAETQLYLSQPIARGRIEQGPELARSALKLSVHRDFPIAELYKVSPPSDPITLLLRQFHYGDSEIKTLWQGGISGVEFSDDAADITLLPITAGLRNFGLRRTYQRACPFVLYGPDCTVDPAAYRVTGSAAVVSGVTVTVVAAAAQPSGYYDGGWLEWQLAAGTYERRFITAHAGTALTLDTQPLGLLAGGEVRIYPGCDHGITTCSAKFANSANYGGFPYTPLKNPFGSDPVF